MSREVEQIKERLDIVSVVGQYVALQKAGANLKACCPFHNEKTPSFMVSPSRGTYYCFGCGAKGDIFTFVEEMEGLDFRGALTHLADKAGVKLSHTSPKQREEMDRALSVLQAAADIFREEFVQNNEASTYLTSRGLTEEVLSDFLIGLAPSGWRNLKEKLSANGYSEEEMLRAGLIKKGETGRDAYDVFRERIIFPIRESSGKIVGFSGRSLDEEHNPPKYLNSPDTVFFNKSEILYGLDKAKHDIREKNYAILVEGQMDLLMSHQAGIKNTVAASGTAVTPQHLERLKKISPRILIALDGDGAGVRAALRTATEGLKRGMDVKIARLPKGEDPAEMILKDVEGYKNALRKALPFIEFVLETIIENSQDERARALRVEREIIPLLSLLGSAVERSHTIKVISRKTSISEGALEEDTAKFRRNSGKTFAYKSAETVAPAEKAAVRNQSERHVAGLLFAEESGTTFAIPVKVLTTFLNDVERSSIMERYKPDRESLVFEVESYYGGEDQIKARQTLEEVILNYKDDVFKKRLGQLNQALSLAEKKKDIVETERILREMHQVSEERKVLTAEMQKK